MKRFSDAETARILARAAELSAQKAIVERDGSSLEDLERIAEEAGVDVAMVRRAVLDVAAPDHGERSTDLVHTGFQLSADVDGTLDDAGLQAVLHEVRARFPFARPQVSTASLLVFESPFGMLFSVASSGSRTRVVLDWNRHIVPKISKKMSFGIAAGASLFSALLGDTLVEAAVLAGGCALIAAFSFGLARAFRPLEPVVMRRRRARLTTALDGVLTVLRAHASSTPPSS